MSSIQSKLLQNLSTESLSSMEFGEYIYDYYTNPSEYDIDEDSDYFAAISDAYSEIGAPVNLGEITILKVEKSKLFKEYKSL